MDKTPYFELLKLIHQAVCGERGKGKEIAKVLNVPYSTMMREVNPYDDGAKLSIERFCRIMQATNDYRPLERLVDLCGFTLSPKTQEKHA